jgi:hypothetical protein
MAPRHRSAALFVREFYQHLRRQGIGGERDPVISDKASGLNGFSSANLTTPFGKVGINLFRGDDTGIAAGPVSVQSPDDATSK